MLDDTQNREEQTPTEGNGECLAQDIPFDEAEKEETSKSEQPGDDGAGGEPGEGDDGAGGDPGEGGEPGEGTREEARERAQAIEVTSEGLERYGDVDREAVKKIRAQWRKERRIKRLTPINTLLMLGVTVFVPWYVYNDRQDLAYFFSSGEAVELGDAASYRMVDGEASKPQDFPDNRLVHMTGIPIRHVGIQSKDTPFSTPTKRLIYMLMGSSVYIKEDMENSKYAAFMSRTSTSFGADIGVDPIEMTGRMRRFDTAETKQFAPVRDYYAEHYGTVFCQGMSESERKRKAALLGRGGVAVQIMPDGSVIQAETDTHETLTHVVPLRGRAAIAVGHQNTLLHTIDAGLTWRKAQLPFAAQATAMAYDAINDQIVFGTRGGWAGSNTEALYPQGVATSQDITDMAFTQGDGDAPRLIAVGREGLIEVGYADGIDWKQARIDDDVQFNDVLYADERWFAVGSQDKLMVRSSSGAWQHGVSPIHADWLGLSRIPGAVVATGTRGAVVRYDLNQANASWELWPVDDVPGIDLDADIRASAVSDDGKTWVGVGTQGAIFVAQADEQGTFGRIRQISGAYAGYGIVQDLVEGNRIEYALREAWLRHTQEDFHDVTYHDGAFYAVGDDSLLMTSPDGISWRPRPLHVKHKTLRTIAFVDEKNGVIGGEKGTLLVTHDGGATWRSKKAPTERSIYDIDVAPGFDKGFVFAGAYGLWGFCHGVDERCYLRSKNAPYHYRAIALEPGTQKAGFLHVVAAGDDARLLRIQDAPENAGTITPIWTPERPKVLDMRMAREALPLVPNSARGHLGLIATADGAVFRSVDAGYTFRREETGLRHPVRKLALSSGGDVAWAFDDQNHVVQDLRGLGQWTALELEPGHPVVDGVFDASAGYIATDTCLYQTTPRHEFTKRACLTTPDVAIVAIARRAAETLLVIRRTADPSASPYLASLLDGTEEIVPKFDLPKDVLAGVKNKPHLQIEACGDKIFVVDPDVRMAWALSQDGTASSPLERVGDTLCDDGKMTVMQVSPHGSQWAVDMVSWNGEGTSPIFSTKLGFEPSQFARMPDGRWWMSGDDGVSRAPLVMMSRDGEHWSWRRDHITDYHAVAVAGEHAVAVGDDGTILVSENNGVSWKRASASPSKTLRDVCLTSDASLGIAVGDAGTIFRAQNGLSRWSKLNYKLDLDITSCAIVEQKDRTQIYLAGKGGAIYTSPDPELGRLELVASPAVENIHSLAALETGEVLAVGGEYQDPATICEEGFLIEADKRPRDLWPSFVIALLLGLFWVWTLKTFVLSIRHRHKFDTVED